MFQHKPWKRASCDHSQTLYIEIMFLLVASSDLESCTLMLPVNLFRVLSQAGGFHLLITNQSQTLPFLGTAHVAKPTTSLLTVHMPSSQ